MTCCWILLAHEKVNYDDEIDLFKQELNNQYYLLLKILDYMNKITGIYSI